MKKNRETKKTNTLWRSRTFCILATTLILWVWGDIAQPQATSCQVGTYDCAGSLYLYNGKVGIGTANPQFNLDLGTAAGGVPGFDKFASNNIELVNQGGTGDGVLTLHHAGVVAHQLRYANGTLFLEPSSRPGYGTNSNANLAISGKMTVGIVPLARIEGYIGSKVIDVPNLTVGAAIYDDVTITGAAMGDFVLVSSSIDMLGVIVTGSVTGTNRVKLLFHNASSQWENDLPPATYYVKVIKRDF